MMTGSARPPKAVLFDLDGTLVDSAPDLRAALNELLSGSGLPPVPLDAVKTMIGHGVRTLVERGFAYSGRALSEAELDREHEAMLPIYGRHLTGLTILLPGAIEALTFLRAAGVKLAVVTNKPSQFTGAVLDHYGFTPLLDFWIGGDGGVPKKPAPDMLLHALRKLSAKPVESVMVGDGIADMISARAANVTSVLVEQGGYRTAAVNEMGADIVIPTLIELPEALGFTIAAA